MMATFIYMGLFYNALPLLITSASAAGNLAAVKRIRLISILLIKCLLLNIFSGALVAGIDAGKVYTLAKVAITHGPL
jgi:heme A synthase